MLTVYFSAKSWFFLKYKSGLLHGYKMEILLTPEKSNFSSRRTYKLMTPWLNLVPAPALCWRASIRVEPA